MNAVGIPNSYDKKKNKNNNSSSVDNNNSSVDNNNSSVDNNNGSSGNNDIGICVLFIFLVLCFIGFVVYFGFTSDGSTLEFHLNSLEVTSMKVYNISSDYYSIVRDQKHITADLDFNLTLENKDEEFMYFNPMQVSLEYRHDEFLSSTMLEPFLLLEDQRDLQFVMRIKDDEHLQKETVDSISQDLWRQNTLQFSLKA